MPVMYLPLSSEKLALHCFYLPIAKGQSLKDQPVPRVPAPTSSKPRNLSGIPLRSVEVSLEMAANHQLFDSGNLAVDAGPGAAKTRARGRTVDAGC